MMKMLWKERRQGWHQPSGTEVEETRARKKSVMLFEERLASVLGTTTILKQAMPSSKAELNLVRSSLLHAPPQRSAARGAVQARNLEVAVGVAPHAAGSARAVRAGTEARAVLSAEVVEGSGGWEIDVDS